MRQDFENWGFEIVGETENLSGRRTILNLNLNFLIKIENIDLS
jgi:hypothetical protein